MPDIIKPQQGILFMKVGVHAKEDLESIIKRKTQEIEDAGFALWGYGGGTCHPATMVQPFAKQQAQKGQKIFLCMQEMNSNHFAEPVRAEEYSIDGKTWNTIPKPIHVLGSRFALAIKELRREELILPLNKAQVAVGNSQGRLGHRYIGGRVDKACLELTDTIVAPPEPDDPVVKISLVAELCEPYAVFLRN
ncbi:hypothetical protein EDC30_103202 [Paucimonas lemoignei]|uniref:Uncharacterized protein n=1 Tax=Paucimonas lemoignei TaxID=29443 RepID=A0A4V2UIY1_PAULE|nr:hypothetical protein [Paucimonas lemoignei]TCS37910.1 hypothetical protein EDC30_103202 [Paucimonas lemoignei]